MIQHVQLHGLELIRRERARQILQEGFTSEIDDLQDEGELAIAAACYAVEGTDAKVRDCVSSWDEDYWPCDPGYDKRKKHDRLRRLVIAGALIAAEIDREIRARMLAGGE